MTAKTADAAPTKEEEVLVELTHPILTATGFQMEFPVEGLRGAPYNPRKIDDDTLEVLGRSIETVGFAKPIIVTQDGLIIAGHQRTKAARALGLVTVPAYVLAEITTYDEVRFNQLHNGTDLDKIDKPVTVVPRNVLGFAEVNPDEIFGDLRSEGAWIRNEINRLLLRYGNWGCAVVTQSGVVVSSPQYLLACKATKIAARVYYTPDEQMVTASGFFHRTYGRFSYEHLKRTPWIQTFAQPFRLRTPADSARSKALLESVLYMQVMDTGPAEGKPIAPGPNPHIRKDGMRVLDFGCGQGDYVKLLLSMGYNIRGMEFFRRAGNMLDTGAVRRMADAIARDIRKNGLYDLVICDSVVNSVDSVQAEADVVTCLNAFTKPGRKIFFSGRQVEGIEQKARATRAALAGQRGVEFFDENGFSGLYREGTWFYQKFHTKVQAMDLCRKYLGDPSYGAHSPGWQIETTKTVVLSVEDKEASIRREFNLAWPDGESVGKGEEMVAAWREAIKISGSE